MPADPTFSNVSLLLHGDGVDGSTTFTDSSPRPKAVTRSGAVTISTTRGKSGGASIYFPGSSDYLSVAPDSDFTYGTGDFTVEFWFYCTSVTSGARPLFIGSGGDGILQLYFSGTSLGIETANANGGAGGTVPTNQWVHIAACRASGVVKTFIDGAVAYSYTDPSNLTLPSTIRLNQYGGGGLGGACWMDEVRTKRGEALYAAAFTPPDAPFPEDATFALSGTVRDATSALVARKVAAYREDTNALVGTTTSDATTGAYSITTPTDTAHTLVFYPALGENLNALVRRGVLPIES